MKYLVLEQYESYQKMSYRNRSDILGANKVIGLSVPIRGGRDQKTPIREVEIDNSQRWQMQHWRTIESCYNNSAFFLHYRDGLKQVLFSDYQLLWDLDLATIKWALGALKGDVEIHFTKTYVKEPDEELNDFRSHYSPATRTSYFIPGYQQVFQTTFEPNLSILDLIFNLGPSAKDYLKQLNV